MKILVKSYSWRGEEKREENLSNYISDVLNYIDRIEDKIKVNNYVFGKLIDMLATKYGWTKAEIDNLFPYNVDLEYEICQNQV